MELILSGEAGVEEITLFVIPFGETTVVEHFVTLIDDEWDDIMLQTFLKHNEATNSAITVLERVNALKTHVEGNNVFQRHCGEGVIIIQKFS